MSARSRAEPQVTEVIPSARRNWFSGEVDGAVVSPEPSSTSQSSRNAAHPSTTGQKRRATASSIEPKRRCSSNWHTSQAPPNAHCDQDASPPVGSVYAHTSEL